ncbi:MAG: hypothetical protein Greene041619_613 [Candidatus Peregrinibacteria bacterium Greene0416_19]|nr:MAG: hypothetical protein Greene041619_613 [Candidatus Peregrinibacteria bacterium Greene0416_19]
MALRTPEPIQRIFRDHPYTPLEQIPEESLAAAGVVRLYDEARGQYRMVLQQDFQGRERQCWSLLARYSGYIFAHDLDRMWRHIYRQEMVEDDVLARVAGRAQKFIERGIPPIFDPAFYGRSSFTHMQPGTEERILVQKKENLFPLTDFVIQFATGAYERRRIAMAVQLRDATHQNRPALSILPATLTDVEDFRRVAFTEDRKVSTLLVRETIAYMHQYFRPDRETTEQREWNRSTQTNQVQCVMLFLEDALRDLPRDPPQHEAWNGDVSVVDGRRWYLRFAPSERSAIAGAYFRSLARRPTGKDKDRGTFLRMRALFPELAEQWETAQEKEKRLSLLENCRRALSSGDFSALPATAFAEQPYRDVVLPRAQDLFRSACQRLATQNPDALFSNVNFLKEHLPVPYFVATIPGFRRILDEERLAALHALDDDLFRQLFPQASGRYAAIAHSKSRDLGPAAETFRDSLEQRFRAVYGVDLDAS